MSEVWERDDHPLVTAREGAAVRVASGRGGFAEIYQRARVDLHDTLEAGTDPEGPRVRAYEARLRAFVSEAIADHVQRQRRWPSRTDGERLTRAFRALDESGIIAREDHACCDTCAKDSLDAELENHAGDPGRPAVRGYAYYHWRDVEHAAAGGPLMVGFVASHVIRRAAVGEEVAEALRAHGLTVAWDGDPDQKLRVDMDWRHRRHDRRSAHPGPDVAGEPMVEVGFDDPGTYSVPEWISLYEGRVSVREVSRMVLPWLPQGFVATLRTDRGHSISVEREFDLLRVHEGPVLARERVEEPLSRWAVGAVWPEEDARSGHAGLVDVKYADTDMEGIGFMDHPEPMGTAAARDVVHQLTPCKGTFAVFAAHTDAVVQMLWEPGPRLWLESPSPDECLSRGRHVTVPEAEEMVRILAEEGRAALGELGELVVTAW